MHNEVILNTIMDCEGALRLCKTGLFTPAFSYWPFAGNSDSLLFLALQKILSQIKMII